MNEKSQKEIQEYISSTEEIAQELSKTTSGDSFYGKERVFTKLLLKIFEEMLEAELTSQLGYQPYQVEGRNSGNSRNGHYIRKMCTFVDNAEIKAPRNRSGEFQSELLKQNSNEIEQKVIAMYAEGVSMRDIQDMLSQLYGIDVPPDTIRTITEKVWLVVERWQNRPLAPVYAILILDGIHIKLKRDGKIANVAVYNMPGIDLDGHRDILGCWIGDGAEGPSFWPTVITDLQNCGVQNVSLADLKKIHQAITQEEAEANLLKLEETWGGKYVAGVPSWQNNWEKIVVHSVCWTEIKEHNWTEFCIPQGSVLLV